VKVNVAFIDDYNHMIRVSIHNMRATLVTVLKRERVDAIKMDTWQLYDC